MIIIIIIITTTTITTFVPVRILLFSLRIEHSHTLKLSDRKGIGPYTKESSSTFKRNASNSQLPKGLHTSLCPDPGQGAATQKAD